LHDCARLQEEDEKQHRAGMFVGSIDSEMLVCEVRVFARLQGEQV
jgi:hypothetical protein